MNAHDGSRRHVKAWILAGSVLYYWLALSGSSFPADPLYENAPVLQASKILPADLLYGPNHRVQEKIVNDGYMNTYRIDSKFGPFTAVSMAAVNSIIQGDEPID
jgi:hypothetical protein